MTIQLIATSLIMYGVFIAGFHLGDEMRKTKVKEAFIEGCKKGGNAPALTPWPLCPREADAYLEGSEFSQKFTGDKDD